MRRFNILAVEDLDELRDDRQATTTAEGGEDRTADVPNPELAADPAENTDPTAPAGDEGVTEAPASSDDAPAGDAQAPAEEAGTETQPVEGAAEAVPTEGAGPADPVEGAVEEAPVADAAADVPAAEEVVAEATAEAAPADEVPVVDETPAPPADTPAEVPPADAASAPDVVDAEAADVTSLETAPTQEPAPVEPAANTPLSQDVPASDAPVVDAAPALGAPTEAAAEAEQVADGDVTDTSLDFIEGPESDFAEAADAAANADAADRHIEDCVRTAEDLQAMGTRLAETIPEGGMSEAGTATVKQALESMLTNINAGRKVRMRNFPALESFKSPVTRIQSTKYAVENIQEQAKKIWAHLIEAIKKATAYLVQYFKHAYGGASKLEKRTQDLLKIAESRAGAQIDPSATVSQSGDLAVLGQHKTGPEFLGYLKKHTSQPILNEDRAAKLKGAIHIIDQALTAEGAQSAVGVAQSFVQQFKAGEQRLIFGGAALYTQIDATGNASVKVDMASGVSPAQKMEVGALTPEQAKEVFQLVSDHLKTVTKNLQLASQEAEASANALISRIQGTVAGGEMGQQVVTVFRGATALTTGAAKALVEYDLRVLNQAVTFAAQSLTKVGSSAPAVTPGAAV